ncbi:CRE-TRE-5 protein [Caenorhabditis remanei]|uniref:Trehalase n=1 Tax=Caenorhabditis remanei TaxID=31234 RepID=E3NBA6_CAERE|nr:CRE-TRE-5 protein [Caenorhabditis remanei]
MRIAVLHLLLTTTVIPGTVGRPQKDPRGNDIIDERADFGTPEHDNRVHTELTELTNRDIARLIGADYFNGSVLPCDNETAPGQWMVYCSGRLLQTVMAVKLYPDSKTFVDQPMKVNQTGELIMEHFERRFPVPIEEISKKDVAEFVDEFFDKEGNELDVCNLPDWKPITEKLTQIQDDHYQAFAQRLHFIWIQLCRQMKPEVKEDPSRFSLIYVPHQFILPGGRFREFYYWDAYWIVKGLIASELYSTARMMILNFAHIIETYGFVPNGGRVYYLRRSQPPFFAPMVYEYYQATQDVQLVIDMIPVIEKEYVFWSQRRSVNITLESQDLNETVHMFQYHTEAETPRPESFREDVLSAEHFSTKSRKRQFFKDIGSAAESGWDFSSRWFKDHKNLSTIETTNIVPVDLNAFLCYNMNIMQFFYELTGNPLKHMEWSSRLTNFRQSFTKVFYVPSRKGWYDYNLRTGAHNTDFFPSNAAPLFAQCYDPLNSQLAVDVYNQMEASGAFGMSGGVPTSMHKETQQQWDYPNGWSPLNHMIIEGLRKSINPTLQQKAFVLAEKWLETNMQTFNVSNAMWEKYNVQEPQGKLATGGEYEVQVSDGDGNALYREKRGILSLESQKIRNEAHFPH